MGDQVPRQLYMQQSVSTKVLYGVNGEMSTKDLTLKSLLRRSSEECGQRTEKIQCSGKALRASAASWSLLGTAHSEVFAPEEKIRTIFEA